LEQSLLGTSLINSYDSSVKDASPRGIQMKSKSNLRSAAVFITLLITLCSFLAIRAANASDGLNLPSGWVYIAANNSTESYFLTTLSGVPSGYDVANETYFGWCVDMRLDMTRNQTFQALLYSSLNPPANLSSQAQWNMTNYILNHKQGNFTDIQEAIWYFTIADYTGPLSTLANAMIQDAVANGTNFSPAPGETVAIICYPLVIQQQWVQVSIIEYSLPAIPEFPSIALPLFIALGAISATTIYRKKRSGSRAA
jgi:hypothetical protein